MDSTLREDALPTGGRLDRAHAGELLDGGDARGNLPDPVFPHRAHPLLACSPLELVTGCPFGRELLQPLAHLEQLEDADPAAIAGLAAPGAAPAPVERRAFESAFHLVVDPEG